MIDRSWRFSFRRPQQNRQPGATGGQGNVAAGAHRGGNKEALQPANIPVSKSMFKNDLNKCFLYIFLFF